MPDLVLLLTTVPSPEVGERLAQALVDERLAACVNVLPPMVSIYRWQGQMHRDVEQQLVIKTSRARLAEAKARLTALHLYDLPECLVLSVDGGDPAYLAWVAGETEG